MEKEFTVSDNNKRIAKNTMILYVRMFILMAIGIFTTRLNFEALGDENLGIYNVVGGIVGMFCLISLSLSSSISRFITFGLGTNDEEYVRKVFSISINIQLMLAVIVLVFAESVGLWFLYNKLVIPADRMFAASVVYQVSIVSFVLSLFSTPYDAAIIAHEKMGAFAFMTLFDAGFKLLIPISLFYLDSDRLIVYGILLCVQGGISQAIYWLYCRRKFAECRYHFETDKQIHKEMFGFAGWNFIGCSAAILNGSGVNVVLNMFFGPLVNTARMVSSQITGIMTRFCNNFMTAVNPQITKDYASGQYDVMINLMMRSTKVSYLLFWTLSLPVLLEAPQLIRIWLGHIPEYSVIFCQLSIVSTLTNIFSNTLITAQNATGNIRNYQIVVGGALLLNLPFSYVCLKIGLSPYSVMVVAIVVNILCLILRLSFLRKSIGLSVKEFCGRVISRCFVVSLLTTIIPSIVYFLLPEGLLRLIIVCVIAVTVTALLAYYVGLDNAEKKFVMNIIRNVKSQFAHVKPCNSI